MNWNPICSVIDENVRAVSDDIRKRVIAKFEHGSYPLRFYMTDSDYESIKEALSPRPVTFDGTKQQLHRHPHPVPAELQRYAYEKCIEVGKNFSRCIDIGGTPLRTPKHHHICTLIADTRTEARYLNAYLQLEGNINSMKYLCKHGAQNCNITAPYAYMINVYDIPIEDIPNIMERHGCITLDIWMFFPHNLVDKMFVMDQTFYKNEIIETPGTSGCCRDKFCRFSLNDNSNAYYHNYYNWKKYMCTTHASSPYYEYVFEHIEQLSTFTNIRVTRTSSRRNQYLYRTLNLKPNDTCYIVPDVPFYWTTLHAAGNMFQRTFLIDKTIVDSALKWCQRIADNMFNYPSFAATFDAKSISVYYTVEKQQRLVYKGLTLDHDTYERLQISLYMIGAVNRFHRTQGISGMFQHLRNCDGGFWDKFKHSIKVFLQSTKDKIFATLAGHSVEHYLEHVETASNTYMPDLRIKTVPKYVVNGYINTKGYGKTDATFLELPDIFAADADIPAAPENKKSDGDKKLDDGKKKLLRREDTHTKMIHDPPGDGSCGIHALRFFHNKFGISTPFIVPKNVEVRGSQQPLSTSMHDIHELAWVAKVNNMNFICHVPKVKALDAYIMRAIYDSKWPTAKVQLIVNHYVAVDCDCEPIFMGDYGDIEPHTQGLYVNCANSMLTDGAGQAAAFRLLFQGYDANINKPVQPLTFTKHGKYHLALAVALDANVKTNTKVMQQQRLKEIFDGIDKYALKNKLTVYMPLIGTAIYGNDLCCVKTSFERLKCKKVLCIYNRDQRINYNKTHLCAHGGYTTLGIGKPLQPTRSKYDPGNWMHIAPDSHPDKMINKYRDIEKVALEYKCNRIVELSCAPGHFYRVPNKKVQYLPCHYINGDFHLMKNVVAHPWTKYTDLPKVQDADMVLLDHSASPGDMFFTYAKMILGKSDVYVTSKFQAYVDDDERQTFETYLCDLFSDFNIHIWRNDGSELASAEVYYTISNIRGVPRTVDIAESMQTLDAHNAKKQVNDGCRCGSNNIEYANAVLKWKPDLSQFALFKKSLHNDPYLKENLDEEDFEFIDDAEMTTNEIDARLGVAGSGKSKLVLDNFCGYCSLIIAPLRVVTFEHNEKIKTKIINNDSRAVTFIKAIKLLKFRGKSFDQIFIDEIFLVNPYFIDIYRHLAPNAAFLALGDQFQIKTDFQGTAPSYKIEMIDDLKYISESKRCPKSIEPFVRNYIPDFTANPSRIGKIIHGSLEKIQRFNNDIMLCATQKMKIYLEKELKQPRVSTIHEAMGGTYETVHIITTDIDQIHGDRSTYVYTALSRATDTIVMYGTGEQNEHFMAILGSPLERAIATPMVESIPVNEHRVERTVEDVPIKEQLNMVANETTNLETVRDIMRKVYPKKNPYMERKTLDIRINMIAGPESGEKLKIPAGAFDVSDVKINGRMIDEPYVKYYAGADKLNTINTINKRYMSKHLQPSYKMYTKLLDAHYLGLETFLKPRDKRAKLILGHDEIYRGICEYLIRLQNKYKSTIPLEDQKYIRQAELDCYNHLPAQPKFREIVGGFIDDFMSGSTKQMELQRKYEDLIADMLKDADATTKQKFDELNTEWYDQRNKEVKFHMKNQPKEIRELWWDTSDKAGQGISAWSKISNIMFASMQKQLHDWVKESLADNCMWAVDKSDHDIAEEFKKKGYGAHLTDARAKTHSKDATAFDQSQKHVGNVAIAVLAKSAGAPARTVDHHVNQREKWTATAMFDVDQRVQHALFVSRFMMTSGHLVTLTFNTMYSMTIIGGGFKYTNLRFAMFKGDDSVVCCDKCEERKYDGQTLMQWCQYILKDSVDVVPEFIANFLNPWGFFPDVLRRVSRVVGRIVTHPEQWEEMRRSVADCLDVINNNSELHLGILAAKQHYNSKGIMVTYEEIEHLVAFLKRVTWDDKLAPTVTGEWQILYYDISRMIQEMHGATTTYYN